jgi:hypothetical protein
MPDIDPMLNAACNRQPPDPPDIVERLDEVRCDREPFTAEHANCVCRLTHEAAAEIQRLRNAIEVRDAFIMSKGLFEECFGQSERN